MTELEKAARQALEALKMCRALIRINIERLVPIESPNPWFSQDVDHAITAIREALDEQPAQQEPFGYFKPEPFGWTDCAETDEGAIALYDRPPASKPWVGLTYDDLDDIAAAAKKGNLYDLRLVIEAKLREKNAQPAAPNGGKA